MYANIKSLCSTPETNIIYVSLLCYYVYMLLTSTVKKMRNEIPKDRVGNGLGGLTLVKFQLLDNK